MKGATPGSWWDAAAEGIGAFGVGLGRQLLVVAAILLGAHVLVLTTRRIVRAAGTTRLGRRAKVRTLVYFVGSVAVFVVYFAAIGLALRELGVPLTAYLASATVIGFAVSFGSQSVVQDVISGVTLITSDLLDVGDIVEISGQVGRVRAIGIRYTKLATLAGSTVYVPNRNVANVVNFESGYSRLFLDVQLPEGAREAAMERLRAICASAREQFGGVMRLEPELRDRGPAGYARLEFRLWPGQAAVVEGPVRQRALAAMRTLDDGYADWMVVAHQGG